MKKDRIYQEQLLKRLSKSFDLKREKALLNQLYKNSVLGLINEAEISKTTSLNGKLICPRAKGQMKEKCLKCLRMVLNKARKSRNLEKFACPSLCYGLCLPLVQGDALYGFLVLCNLENNPSTETLRLFQVLNSTILEKMQKELELSKLYQTIRPRAIALSTTHTIHRLISSSLNLDELLPKIARLSLQVLRAKRCLISLINTKKTGRLEPKAMIDLSKKDIKPRISFIMKKIERKVMRTGNILLKKSYLSIPLIDEEPIGVITIWQKMSDKPFNSFDQEILTALSEQAVGAIKNAQLYKEQEHILLGTVKSLSSLLKIKSAHAYTHSKAFTDIALGIAKKFNFTEKELQDLHFAVMLHDAEKIAIPEEILKKPTQLTGREFKIVKEHPKKSLKILSPLERLKPVIAIMLHHHEKFDGTGYPDRLKGENIPLGARIVAVADSFDAMISRRPYRKSTSITEAIREIKRHSGTQFDPQVINAFLRLTKDKYFKKIIRGTHSWVS